MTRDQLEHAIRAACDVAGDTEVWIFGSQAILGTFADAPEPLRASVEVDVQPKNRPEATDLVDGLLGEISQFHETFGFYVQGVSITAAKLPSGWQDRVVEVRTAATRGCAGLCLEVHDLAASKLAAYRDKDKGFVRVLLREALIDPGILGDRISCLPIDEPLRERISRWLAITSAELGAG